MLLFIFSSCSKKSEDTSNKTEDKKSDQTVKMDDNDITESAEDLQSIDYKEIYDKLSAKGEWVQVNGTELGIDTKKSAASDENEFQRHLISYITGVDNAYATEADLGLFFVWKPADNLAVSVTAGEPAVYTPYTNGSWVNTDAGWYFKAPTPEEEIVHHYGRWVYSPAAGWLWVPGRVWAPAWVDWRQNDDYIAWAPVPPMVYIVNNSINVPPIDDDRYVIIEKRYFVEPEMYKYMYKENKNKIMIKEMHKVDGIMVMNKTVINKGPDVTVIENITGKKLEPVKIERVKDIKDVKYEDTKFVVYNPSFTKVKTKGNENIPVSKPGKVVNFNEVKQNRPEEMKNESGIKDGDRGNKNKEYNNEKGNVKLGDDRGMHKDKEIKGVDNNGYWNKENGHGNKDNGHGNVDNGHGNKDNGNGNKDNGDKGNKEKGNEDKGKGKK